MPAATSTALPPFGQEMRGKYQVAFFHVVVYAFYQWLRLIWLVVFCHFCRLIERGKREGV